MATSKMATILVLRLAAAALSAHSLANSSPLKVVPDGTSSPITGSMGSTNSGVASAAAKEEALVGAPSGSGISKGGKGAGGKVKVLPEPETDGAVVFCEAEKSSRVSMRWVFEGVGSSDSKTHCNKFFPKVANFFS